MTLWRVTWTKSAKNYYNRMEREYQEGFQEAIKELEINPLSVKNVKRSLYSP